MVFTFAQAQKLGALVGSNRLQVRNGILVFLALGLVRPIFVLDEVSIRRNGFRRNVVHPKYLYEPRHGISNNVVCATSKASVSLRIRAV